MIIDFRLKVFRTVARELSFTAAARLLYISQPAATKHIRELEKQIQRPLFNRMGRRISLTTEGELLLDYTNKILDLYEALEVDVQDLQNVEAGEMRLGGSTTIAQYILPALLAKFRKRHGQIKIVLQNANTETIEHFVSSRKIDLGLIESPARNPLLHYEPFVRDEIVLVTRFNNEALATETLTSERLRSLPLVLREEGSGTRAILLEALAGKGISLKDLNIEMELGSTESIKSYLRSSDAFAFLSVHTVLPELTSRQFSLLDLADLEINRVLQFVTLHGQYNPLLARFRRFCLTHYNQTE